MSLFFAFIAGIVTVLSPCVLPLLPVILASSSIEGRWRPAGLIVGFAVFFTGITLFLSLLVRQVSISPDAHRTAAALIFILMGLVLAVPAFKARFEIATSGFLSRFAGGSRHGSQGFLGGLFTGAGLGLAWTPCVGPIMAAVITLALNQQTTLSSTLTAISFSLGTALPMGAAVLFGQRLYSRTAFLKRNSARIQQLMGVIILLVGLGIWFGIDRSIQILLFKAFPGWEAALTGWERAVTP
ncbi:cytochrome c biogenesis CcdA family protein [Aquamicrobium zhengzhouense]|uniref:Cytochrome c biogenesis protein CcdA n=1 Tax=Aquamicrobium zhengzhouense TaxID=2781738 RepID=A0ABS0SEU9_9HYPH|nr:cytochrome c biogenesis CcdA family protein [Aquamicrobium zhengzhouense]MBI1621814.1 cytochrome c biogenesis protein CcdA [Aquamicrobium zhengzhouense]